MDFEYLSRRYEDELKHASAAESNAARDAHLALADQYLVEIERLKGRNGGQLRVAAQ